MKGSDKDNTNVWYVQVPSGSGYMLLRGPYSDDDIKGLWNAGDVAPTTLVRYGTDGHWKQIQDITHFSAFAGKPSSNNTVVFVLLIFACLVGIYLWNHVTTKKQSVPIPPSYSEQPNIPAASYQGEALNGDTIIELTNHARLAEGLPPLATNPLLNKIAQIKAQDMNDNGYFAHISPNGESASDIAGKVGYRYKILAENICSGHFISNQKVVDGWLQSPGHRKNILSPNVQEIGAAVVQSTRSGAELSSYSVQIFGLQSPPVSPEYTTTQEQNNHPPSTTNSLAPAEDLNNAHRACQNLLNNTNQVKIRADQLREQLDNVREENKQIRDMVDKERNEIDYDRQYLANTRFDREHHRRLLNERVAIFNRNLQKYKNAYEREEIVRQEYNTEITYLKSAITTHQECLRNYLRN